MTNPLWKNSRKQAVVYSYGKLDDVRMGGTQHYGQFHQKIYVIDGNKTYVGSSNIDPRSRQENTESVFLLEGPAAADLVLSEINYSISLSTVWGSPEWQEIRNRNKGLVRKQTLIHKFFEKMGLEPLL